MTCFTNTHTGATWQQDQPSFYTQHEHKHHTLVKITRTTVFIAHCVFATSHYFSSFFEIIVVVRALNEMWKCQNMLRGLVKELLDLHKLPVVSSHTQLHTFPPCLLVSMSLHIFDLFVSFSLGSLKLITHPCLGS